MNKKLIIIGAVVLVIVIFFWATFNSLVTRSEAVDNQWAQVETQYQRRFDLIPNLVESVKGVMAQEQKIFLDLAAARASYSGAKGVNEKVQAASQVESSFSRLIAVMENYPQLKSSENVQTLMAQLEGTENRISVERKRFNDTVKDFNLTMKRFPTNMIASMFGYTAKNYFEAAEGTEKAVKVEF